jgi:hypothetical protein
VTLSVLLVVSVLGGLTAFSGAAAAANTAQLDFSSIYNADVVRGTADSTDGDFDNGGYTLVSSSTAQNNGNPADDGVPDDGVFPAVTDVHPEFDLADFNSDDNNAWQTTGTGSVTASVSNDQYETVHVVASAGGADPSTPARFKLILHYADGSTVTSSEFTVPDWFGSPPSDPGYAVRDDMDRYGSSYENANDPAIWGYAVSADSSKTLEEVTIDVTENQAGSFNFFGGAATTQTSTVVNGAPTANDDTASTDEDTTVTVDVVSNDDDPDGDPLDVSAITNGPSHGTALITGASNDEIEFDPGTDRTSDVSITYEVSDGNGGTDTATLSITVNPVNDAPTASDGTGSTDEDTPLSVSDGASTDLLELASDPDGDTLSLNAIDGTSFSSGTPVTLDSGATVTANSDGSWTYDPNGQFEALDDGDSGTDSFTYTVDDGNGGTDQATITLTVTGVTAPSGSYDPPDETPPTADAGPDRAITVGESVTINAGNSSDDEELGTIQWDIDDDGGYEKRGLTATLTFDSPGEHRVSLRVWDESGNSDTDTIRVAVAAPTTVSAEPPGPTTRVPTTSTGPATTPGPGAGTPLVSTTTRPETTTVLTGTTDPSGRTTDATTVEPDRTSDTTNGPGTGDGARTTASGPGFGMIGALVGVFALVAGLAHRRDGN